MKPEEAIDKILEIRKLAGKHKKDPAVLSMDAVALAVYNAYIGDVIADLHQVARQTELNAFKEARNREETVADSEKIAREKASDAIREYEQAKYVYQSTNILITAIQSHVKAQSIERSQSGQ